MALHAAARVPKGPVRSVVEDAWEPSPAPMHGRSLDVSAEAKTVSLCHTRVTVKKRGWGRGSQMKGLGRGPSTADINGSDILPEAL